MEIKSALEMAGGAIMERLDYTMAQIVNNILDVNTRADQKRAIILKLEILPDSDRRNWRMSCTAEPKFVKTNPIVTSLYATCDERGAFAVVELTPQVPGQVSMGGEEQEEPVLLKLVSGGN